MKKLIKFIKSLFSNKEKKQESFEEMLIRMLNEAEEKRKKQKEEMLSKLCFIENSDSNLQIKIINEPSTIDGAMSIATMLGISDERADELESIINNVIKDLNSDRINIAYMLAKVSSFCKHPNELGAVCLLLGMNCMTNKTNNQLF